MYSISNEMELAFNNSFRDESYIRIVYGLVDPDAPSLATLADSGHLGYSDVTKIDDKKYTVTTTYETLELNRFILDGSGELQVTGESISQGYVSDVMSNELGLFTTNPSITVNFSQYVSLAGLTFTFDSIKEEYPSLFNVTTYSGTTIVTNDDYTPTESFFPAERQMDSINKIVITFKKTVLPYRRIRLFNLVYGLLVKLNTDDITKCELTQTIELGSFSLPKNNFSFEILDLDRAYDPENPNNLIKYLESGQEVTFDIGQKLGTGKIEWIPMSTTYTDGNSSVSDGSICKLVKVTSTSLVDRLEQIYDEGIYNASGVTFYDLAVNILTFAGFRNNFVLSDTLKSYTTKIVPYNKTVKQCLQLIANACCCNFIIQRDGVVRIEPLTFGSSVFDLNLSKMTNDPVNSKIPTLRNLLTKYSSVSLGTTKEIANVTVSGASNTMVVINYKPSTNVTYTLETLTVVGTPTIFSTKMIVFVTGSGIIKVNGNELVYTDVAVTKSVNNIGSDLTLSNEFISNIENTTAWSNFNATLMSYKDSYVFDNRGYPQLDVSDCISFQNSFADSINGVLIENTLSFTGTLSSKSKVVAI